MGRLLLFIMNVYYRSVHVVVIHAAKLEGGDEGGHAPAWGGVRLRIVFGTSV